MPVSIVRDDITLMRVDAIVNPTNNLLIGTGGTDGAVHRRAGEKLDEICRKIGHLDDGCAVITDGFDLPAKHIIHTVGPVWDGGNNGERDILADCYRNCLEVAVENKCKSIAFPMISTGTFGFPKDEAMTIADREIRVFLENHEKLHVYIVVFDKEALTEGSKLYEDISQYIDDNYVEKRHRNYRSRLFGGMPDVDICNSMEICRESIEKNEPEPFENILCFEDLSPAPAKSRKSKPPVNKINASEKILAFETDRSFYEKVIGYIDEKGWKDSYFYTKAYISKQNFSKMKQPDYHPKKEKACACVLALELEYDDAIDLLKSAGYTLSDSIMYDLVIKYCIQNRIYNLLNVDVILFDMDLPTFS